MLILTLWVKQAKDSESWLIICQQFIFNNWIVKRVPGPRPVSVFRYVHYMRTFDKPPCYLKPPFIRLPSSLVAGNSGVQLERSNYCFLTRLQATLPLRTLTFAAHHFQRILPYSDGFIIRSQPTRTDGGRHNNPIASLQFSCLISWFGQVLSVLLALNAQSEITWLSGILDSDWLFFDIMMLDCIILQFPASHMLNYDI